MQQFNEEDDTTEVDIPNGEVFEISLSENPTTGFRCDLESRGEPACIMVSEYFSRNSDTPGTRGSHHCNFRTVAPGTSTIELTYRRHWQKGNPARTFKLGIRAVG